MPKPDTFNEGIESFVNYKERLDAFIIANDIPVAKQTATLLSAIGAKAYNTLRSLTAPDLPSTKSYGVLCNLLINHFCPPPLEIVERFKFHKRNQDHNESVAEYIAAIKSLSEHCNFGDALKMSLRDRFVCGIKEESIQKRLLQEDNLTFEKATTLALAMETAHRDAAEIHGSVNSNSGQLHKLAEAQQPRKMHQQSSYSYPPCQSCGKTNHRRSDCFWRDATCKKCSRRGHIQTFCHSPNPTSRPNSKPFPRPNQQPTHQPHNVHEIDEDHFTLEMFQLRGRNPKLMIDVIIDKVHTSMEIDTGSAVSVISLADYKKIFSKEPNLHHTDIRLKTYTGEVIHPLGQTMVMVEKDRQTKSLPLLVLQTGSNPIFGRNWLHEIKLDWSELKQMTLDSSSPQTQASSRSLINPLLQKYHEVFEDGIGQVKDRTAKLTVKPDSHPKYCKARPVPYALLKKVEGEIDRLEAAGILTKTTHSEWATPIVPVQKQSGDIRICGDFKVTINPVLNTEQYTLPRIEDIFAQLGQGERFSKIDLRQAYLQLPLDESSKPLTTINTHKGLYMYNRLVFGITSAPAIWQKTMDQILEGAKGVQCNMDDMIITGENDQKHLENLEEVLKRLRDNGLKANLDKCKFLQENVIFCGFRIDKHGLHKTEDKIEAIVNAPVPENKTQLRSFLGLLNYYHKFLDNIAHVAHPLHELLQDNKQFVWTSDCNNAFLQAKQMIASDQVLIRYSPDLPLRLACDASPYGIGCVLSHVTQNNEERPIAYASRTLTPAEKKYAQIDKEAVSIVWGVKKFFNYICGRHFTLVTDHQPLKYIFGPTNSIPATSAARQQRYAAYLSGFDYNIEYRSSANNANADTFSRLPLPTEEKDDQELEDSFYMAVLTSLPVGAMDIAKASRTDPILSQIIHFNQHEWPNNVPEELKPFFHRKLELCVHQDCLLWGTRVIVPRKLQAAVLQQLHEGHLGIVKMKTIARGYFWWPGLDKDIEQMAKSCIGCMYSHPDPQTSPLHPWTFPDKPWQRIHVDYAGPFQGRMFLIVIDAHSKWAEVIPTQSTTSCTTIDILCTIFARFGLPTQLVSDNGPQFTSDEFKAFTTTNSIKHITGAPYKPATNGLAERFVQVFKNAMKSAIPDKGSLHVKLSRFLHAYRNVAHSTTGESPAKLLLGKTTRSRLDVLKPSLSDKVCQQQSKQMQNHSQTRTRTFLPGETVLVRDYRGNNKWIPGTITSQLGPVSYDIKTSQGATWKRHVDQIVYTNTNTNDYTPNPDPCLIYCPEPPNSETQPIVTTDVDKELPLATTSSATVQPNTPNQSCIQPRRSNRMSKPPTRLDL